MGGRGASGKRSKVGGRKVSALEVFKENARQFNEAKEAAKEARASKLEFTTVTGEKINFYWNGAAFTERKVTLPEGSGRYRTGGTYKAKFKPPKNWD